MQKENNTLNHRYPADKIWICDVRRKIEPFHFGMHDGAVPGSNVTYTLVTTWTTHELEEKTFANFEQQRHSAALDHVRAFAFNPQENLMLYGPFGLGKTHLLAALVNLRHASSPRR